MSDTVATVERSAPLDEVVETMFEQGISSLVVTADATEEPVGIITKTDVIEALTLEREDRNAVQVFGLDLLEGMAYDDVSALIESMASKYGEMSVIKASIELQEHKEQSRGMPLVLARIRWSPTAATSRPMVRATVPLTRSGSPRTLSNANSSRGRPTASRKSIPPVTSRNRSTAGGSEGEYTTSGPLSTASPPRGISSSRGVRTVHSSPSGRNRGLSPTQQSASHRSQRRLAIRGQNGQVHTTSLRTSIRSLQDVCVVSDYRLDLRKGFFHSTRLWVRICLRPRPAKPTLGRLSGS